MVNQQEHDIGLCQCLVEIGQGEAGQGCGQVGDVGFGCMTYGPIAAYLVELFPTNIRYTSLSLPYHIGNGWFGGFLPATAFAIVAATGNIYSGLWYPVIIAGVCLVVGLIFMRETKGVDIHHA